MLFSVWAMISCVDPSRLNWVLVTSHHVWSMIPVLLTLVFCCQSLPTKPGVYCVSRVHSCAMHFILSSCVLVFPSRLHCSCTLVWQFSSCVIVVSCQLILRTVCVDLSLCSLPSLVVLLTYCSCVPASVLPLVFTGYLRIYSCIAV